MGNEKPTTEKKKHLFQVEILLENSSHALAIASLMQLLNHDKVKDFRIIGGIELGKIIDSALASSAASAAAAAAAATASQPPNAAPAPRSIAKVPQDKATPASPSKIPSPPVPQEPKSVEESKDNAKLRLELLEEYKERGTLIRLSVVKGKGIRLSLPCRILNFDVAAGLLTIYHVDEKRVYSFKLNEIEDIVANN